MTTTRATFLLLYAGLALLGLFAAAAAEDGPFTLFAFALMLFGVIGAYATIGRAADPGKAAD